VLVSLAFAAQAQDVPEDQSASPPQAEDLTNEFWPEVDFYLNLNKRSRLLFMYTGTKPRALDAFSDGQTGVYFDFWGIPAFRIGVFQTPDLSRSKVVLLRAGYLFSRPKNRSEASIEHMLSAEGTGRAHFGWSLLLSDRNRFDFRWRDGQFSWRYRNRLKIERTLLLGRFELTPYAHAEAFCSLDQKQWTRARFTAGLEWTITKRVVFEVYFARQNEFRGDLPIVRAIGAALQFYLR
jgi:hypothetical protein